MPHLRFVLDNDVDEAVARVLRAAGHEAWRAPDTVIRSDDQVSVYADDLGAVVITHDAEFTRRRRERTFGKHVRLACPQRRAAEVVAAALPELVVLLARRDPMVVEVGESEIRCHEARWS